MACSPVNAGDLRRLAHHPRRDRSTSAILSSVMILVRPSQSTMMTFSCWRELVLGLDLAGAADVAEGIDLLDADELGLRDAVFLGEVGHVALRAASPAGS